MSTDLRNHVVDHARLLVRLLTTLDDGSGATLVGADPELAEQLLAGLDAIYDAAVQLEGGPPPDSPPIVDPDAKRRAYRALVERITDRLGAEVPTGGVVAVVTRGDASLVDLPGPVGWHFPQDEAGTWAGFHPATGRDAVEHLEALRGRGARYLAVPAPSRWWLDFYDDLREHLGAHARLIVDDADVQLFELADEPRAAPSDAATATYRNQTAKFIDLADALLPAGARLLVISRGDDALTATLRARSQHFPGDPAGAYAGHPGSDDDAISLLDERIADGAGFVAIPAPLRWWTTSYPRFCDHMRRHHRCVADQPEAGLIFELTPPTHPPTLPPIG